MKRGKPEGAPTSILYQDLQHHMSGWGSNEKRSVAQKAQWRQKKLYHDQLGLGGKNPARLLVEDGWDGQPVGSVTASSAKRFWSNQADHMVPADSDLVRFGLFFHLDFYQTVALMLKAHWERFVVRKCGMNGGDFLDIVLSEDLARQHKEEFQPKTAAMYKALQGHGGQTDQAGYDEFRKFETLVQEMIEGDLHRVPNESSVLKAFAVRTRKQLELLQHGTPEQEEEFWSLKMAWAGMLSSLGGHLAIREDLRLDNEMVKQRYLDVFHEEHVDLEQALTRWEDMNRRVELKRQHPEWSRARLDGEVRADEARGAAKLEKLKLRAALGMLPRFPVLDFGRRLSANEIAQYEKELKDALVEIFLSTHTDSLSHRPEFAKLSGDQKEFLLAQFRRAVEIKDSELLQGHCRRSLLEVLDIRNMVRATLAHAGIPVRPELVIQGQTLAEQLKWLRTQNELLASRTTEVKAEIRALSNDRETREYNALLQARPQQQEDVKSEMRAQAARYRNEAEDLEKELDALFEANPGSEGEGEDGESGLVASE